MVRYVILALCLLLGGCWGGESLYAAAESRPAIAPGEYRLTSVVSGATDTPVRVALRTDGMTVITPLGEDGAQPDTDDAITLGFVPLGPSGERFVAWVTSIGGEGFGDGAQLYALLVREGAGFRLLLPECSGTRSWAASFGAEASEGSDPVCQFSDRARLEAAMTRFADSGGEGAVVATLMPR